MERTRGSGSVQKVVAETSLRDRIKLVAGIVALATLILFLLQNLQEVDIHFLWFEWSTRMIWALLASAIVGALAIVLFATLRRDRSTQR